MRTIRVGLLGLGRIGRAVVTSAGPAAPLIEASGFAFLFERALVRDVNRPGRPKSGVPLVDDRQAFLAGEYDLVVEALGGVEPARSLVTTLLERGTPVVTANKSLVAACGDELAAAAARGQATLRYEASALAGVPFLGTFGARPLARSVEYLSGIVNGTSNSILSAMEADGLSFADALARAQELGLAETDPSADVEGRDAAEKLILLLRLLGAGTVRRDAIEVESIAGLDAADLQTARLFGGRLKPVVHASLRPSVACFVGPAFVEDADPLSKIHGALNGIRLDGRFVRGLFFAGPGAGPEVTAATILDDVIEAIGGSSRSIAHPFSAARTGSTSAPDSRWFLRLDFPARAPEWPLLSDLLAAGGVWLSRTSNPLPPSPGLRRASTEGGAERMWALTHVASRESLDAALRPLTAGTGARTLALRVLDQGVVAHDPVDEPAQCEIETGALSGVEGLVPSGVEG
jgi:homoserine dehydrogenase